MIKPVSVKPLPNYILQLDFDNGEKRLFDLKPYFAFPYYASLKNEALFKSVHIGDMTIEWANGKDVAPHELYERSQPMI